MSDRILIVDDEPAIRFALADYFAASGYQVDTAQDRTEAEAFLRGRSYALVICDLRMSSDDRADGLEVVRFVKDGCPATPVVLLTAHLSPSVERAARMCGATLAFSKEGPLAHIAQAALGLVSSGGMTDAACAQQQGAAPTLELGAARLGALVDHAFELLWLLDRDGSVLYASPASLRFLGHAEHDVVGRPPGDFVHPVDRVRGRVDFAAALRTPGQLVLSEFRVRHHDGSWRWIEARLRNLLDDPAVDALVLHGEDITERARAEEAIRQLNADLERRVRERTVQLEATNRELESFSYSVSHDLRAPLRHIDGFSRCLEEDYADRLDAEGRQMLTRIRRATERMGQLINDLLDLARVARGELQRAPVDVTAIAEDIAKNLTRAQPERHVDWCVATGVAAHADPRLLQVVFENLLGNAWKYTSKQRAARIEVGCTDLHGEPVFFVRDDGAGFDMADADRLFGTFQRLHSSEEFEGTGVGLATVQRIIHRHGGRIWAESAVGQGATFYFTL